MKFNEAFTDKVGYGLGIQDSMDGYIIVTDHFSYLVSSEDDANKDFAKAIYIAEPTISEKLLDIDAPVMVGSMVLFNGKATIEGTFVKSGMSIMPAAITSIKKLIISHDDEEFEIEFN